MPVLLKVVIAALFAYALVHERPTMRADPCLAYEVNDAGDVRCAIQLEKAQ